MLFDLFLQLRRHFFEICPVDTAVNNEFDHIRARLFPILDHGVLPSCGLWIHSGIPLSPSTGH